MAATNAPADRMTCTNCSATISADRLRGAEENNDGPVEVVLACDCTEFGVPATMFAFAPSTWSVDGETPLRGALPEALRQRARQQHDGPSETYPSLESDSTDQRGDDGDDTTPVVLDETALRCQACDEERIPPPQADSWEALPDTVTCPECGQAGEVVPDRSSSDRTFSRVKGFDQYNPSRERTRTQQQDERGRGVSTGEFDDLGEYL